MALLYQAELRPTKLELLADWLPGRDWYTGPTGMARPANTDTAGIRTLRAVIRLRSTVKAGSAKYTSKPGPQLTPKLSPRGVARAG